MAKQEQANNKSDQQSTADQPEFGIQRVYVQDLSFESPMSPKVFLDKWEPELNMDLATKTEAVSDDVHVVILTVTVTVKMKDKTCFIVEVKQAGIFTLKNFKEDQLRPMLGSFCPNILYPYARQVVTDTVIKGGFPQLYLAPVNFDALYQQHEQQRGGTASAGVAGEA